MKRHVFLALCAFSIAAAGFAKDNLAILPFTGGQGEEGETIAELFSFEPELTAVFNPVPRTSINRAIRSERRFQLESGMTDPDTAAALGKQLGARYVVSGSITALGSQKLLIIAILKIDDLRQIAGDIQTYANIEEIQGKLPGMARSIAAAARADASKLPRLAVVPVSLSGGADPRAADALARILAAHIIRVGSYAVYPRTASLEQIQEEHANQLSGDTANEHLPGLGRGTNPDLVLSVTARKLGNRNMFNAAIINLVTGVQEAGESANYQSLEDGLTAMEDLAFTLAGKKRPLTASGAATFVQAIAAINADTRGGGFTITLNGSFAAAPVTFTGNAAKTITLKGEGAARVITNSGDASLFTVPAGITLVLDNNLVLEGNKKERVLVSVHGGTLVMKAGSTLRGSPYGGVHVRDGGSFTMNGGTISGNTTNNTGGGVYVEGGSFTMSGGTISGNSASDLGAGVFVDSGSFTMSGGTISGNSVSGLGYGGGVFLGGGSSSFTMSGGTISGNTANNTGGGVYVEGGSFTMSGGTISGNTVSGEYEYNNGGGVSVDFGGRFTMSGGTISGNSVSGKYEYSYGGGVSVDNSSFTMSGGTISGNSAGSGGGVSVYNSSFVKRGGGTIYGSDANSALKNTANGSGHAVYVYIDESSGKKRNRTADTGVTLDSSVRGRAGGWE